MPPAGMRSERVPLSFSTRQGSLPETIAAPPVRSQAASPFSNVPPPISEYCDLSPQGRKACDGTGSHVGALTGEQQPCLRLTGRNQGDREAGKREERRRRNLEPSSHPSLSSQWTPQ